MIKFFLIINFLIIFFSSTLKANEIYYACSNKMDANRSESKIFEIGEVFGFTYIKFDKKIKAITKGQSIVLYNKSGLCIGGGIIEKRNIPYLGKVLHE